MVSGTKLRVLFPFCIFLLSMELRSVRAFGNLDYFASYLGAACYFYQLDFVAIFGLITLVVSSKVFKVR